MREGVGIIDVGTLGKFRVSGPDVVAFLERLYPNHVGDIQPGACATACCSTSTA